jgi:hypothetical protein
MQWIKINNPDPRLQLPLDGSTFLATWKGQFCLTSFDEEENKFWLQMLPGVHDSDMLVEHEREKKFSYYAKLEYPKDY